jgi:hypothetical protein
MSYWQVGQRGLKEKNPKIIFWSDNLDAEYPKIEPASIRRDWMDKTSNKFAYKCTPILDAMSNGWEIKLPQDLIVRWDGPSDELREHYAPPVSIISGQFYKDIQVATNETGSGFITFVFGFIAETDDDHYLTISGPPNYIFKDAQPLTGLLRSNRVLHHPLQITWKINTENKEILFPKGMPLCFISIHKKHTTELTDVEIRQTNKEKQDNFTKYTRMRAEYKGSDGQWTWAQFYKKGIDESGTKVYESIKKMILKPIQYIKNNDVL